MKKSKTQIKREEQKWNKREVDNIIFQKIEDEKFKAIKNEVETSDDDTILEKFKEQVSKKEAIVELVDLKNIKMKANLTQEQRDAITILLAIYKKLLKDGYEINAIWDICKEFIEMSPSIDGKRAEQYVDAHKSSLQNNMMNNPNMNGQYGNYSDKMQQMKK
jgi:hypothetical protein